MIQSKIRSDCTSRLRDSWGHLQGLWLCKNYLNVEKQAEGFAFRGIGRRCQCTLTLVLKQFTFRADDLLKLSVQQREGCTGLVEEKSLFTDEVYIRLTWFKMRKEMFPVQAVPKLSLSNWISKMSGVRVMVTYSKAMKLLTLWCPLGVSVNATLLGLAASRCM